MADELHTVARGIRWLCQFIETKRGTRQIMVGRRRRKGRKRKAGKREPSGRIARAPQESREKIAARMPHRGGLPQAAKIDQRAESKFGRLALRGIITQEQYDAGLKFRDAVRQYLRLIEAPSPTPQSLAGKSACELGRWDAQVSAEAERRIRDSYMAAYEALESGAGNRGARAVAHWAVYDKDDIEISWLVRGLDALVDFFGLTARSRQRYCQK